MFDFILQCTKVSFLYGTTVALGEGVSRKISIDINFSALEELNKIKFSKIVDE